MNVTHKPIAQHLALLEDDYPNLQQHIDAILHDLKPHLITILDGGLLVYKVVPEKYIKVNVFHVLPSNRSNGSGTKLLKSLTNLQVVLDLPITITVPTHNVEFINWLQKRSFILGEILKDKYKPNVDMQLLTLNNQQGY